MYSPAMRGVPASTIMKGDWKLTHYFEDDSVQLYNLKDDLAGKTDLSTINIAKTKELQAELSAWQANTKAVIPRETNATFDSSKLSATAKKSRGNRKKKNSGKNKTQ